MSKKTPKWRFLVLAGAILLLVSIGFTAWRQSSLDQNKSQKQPVTSQDDIYVSIPMRSGAVNLDPHWQTTFTDLGLKNLASLEQLPNAPATLDPWANTLDRVTNIFLLPGNGSNAWSITVGHGFVRVRTGETISLYYDNIGLEKSLLKQGIGHGWLTDIQKIFS
jgi:hypothetical protein